MLRFRVMSAFQADFSGMRGRTNVREGRFAGRACDGGGLPAVVAACFVTLAPGSAAADTLPWARAQAYKNSPQINSQRASVRATDEGVPTALSGYRPRLSATATAGDQYLDQLSKTSGPVAPAATYSKTSGNIGLASYG